MQIEVITSAERAGALRPEWDALLEDAPDASVFLSPEWLLSWWDAFGAGLDMHLVAVREAGGLVGLFPLAHSEGRLQGWSNGYSDRFGPIVDASGQEAVEAAARHLADLSPLWTRFDLVPLTVASPTTRWVADALQTVGAGNRAVTWWRSPIVDLPDDPGQLRAGLSGSFRSTLRRKMRKAEGQGFTSEIRTDAAAMVEAFQVSEEGWAHRAGTGIGSTGANRRFYTGLVEAAARRGWLRIGLLRDATGQAVAFELNLNRENAAVNLKLGFRDSVAGMSPGVVLRAAVIDALIAEGAPTFDLLGHDEPYKLHWTDRTVEHVRLRAYPPNAVGRARHLYRHRLRPAVGGALGSLGRVVTRKG